MPETKHLDLVRTFIGIDLATEADKCAEVTFDLNSKKIISIIDK